MIKSEKIKITEKQWFKFADEREVFKNFLAFTEFECNWTKKEFFIVVYYNVEKENDYTLFRMRYGI